MAISRSLIPQQISKGGKMPKVGEKHFKYTKKGREKAKKHAKKTGQEIEYMGGGVVNRKYYAMGGKIQAMRKKRKEKKTGKAALAGAQAIMSGMYVGGAGRAGKAVSKFIKRRKKFSGKGRGKSKAQNR